MTPANPDALADALAACLDENDHRSRQQEVAALIAGPLAPILADLQRVTAERDEARDPFGDSSPTVDRIALLMGQVWLEAKGGTGDTITSAGEFALFSPEDYTDCCTVAKAVLAAVDPAKANDRADAAEARAAQLQAEVEALKEERQAVRAEAAELAGVLCCVSAYDDPKALRNHCWKAGAFLEKHVVGSDRTALAARAATAREGQADE